MSYRPVPAVTMYISYLDMISHMMLTNNHISVQRLGEKNNQSRADLGFTNSQINGVVSIRKNSYDESASFADTDAITETTESSQFVPKSRWRQSVAYDAKHMEGGGGEVADWSLPGSSWLGIDKKFGGVRTEEPRGVSTCQNYPHRAPTAPKSVEHISCKVQVAKV